MADNQWRRNPFTGDTYPVSLSEVHTVKFFTDWNAYGIQLDESIFLENPSSVSIVENVTGGTVFTEIPRTSSPSAGQFRVDYEAKTYTGTSRIQFNPSDTGTEVLVEYKGLGILNKTENYVSFLVGENISANSLTTDAGVTVGTNLAVGGDGVINGNLQVGDGSTGTGNVTITGIFTGNTTNPLEIDPNANTIKNLADGVAPSDAATVGQAEAFAEDATSITIGATGTHAPSGTPVKMAWFEGSSNSFGEVVIAHGLGSNILGFTAYINTPSTNIWTEYFINQINTGKSISKYYNNTNIYLNITGDSNYQSGSARFLVWYKG